MIAWQRDLETATTPAEVVQLARGFLAALGESERAGLPEGCRPEDISCPRDLQACSRRLTDAYWASRSTGQDTWVIQEAWSFFLRAAIQSARMLETRSAT